MQFTVGESRLLIENSIERVLNNAIYIGMKGMNSNNIDVSERSGILVDDCEALKALVTRLWDHARNEVLTELESNHEKGE